jgi:hypothetical protein
LTDWDYPIDLFLKHAHFANWGHMLWAVFAVFPKETIELLRKWKEIKQEVNMDWTEILKDVEKLPTLAPLIGKTIEDIKLVIADIQNLEDAVKGK